VRDLGGNARVETAMAMCGVERDGGGAAARRGEKEAGE
jgi:hypothetical protein